MSKQAFSKTDLDNILTSLNYYDNAKSLTELKKDKDFGWLKEINTQALQATLKNLEQAYKNFFKTKKGYPNYKSKTKSRQSFQVPQYVKIDENKSRISIPKFVKNNSLKAVLHRKPVGKLLFATVSKTPTGKYFISITFEENRLVNNPNQNKAIGIDTGIKELLTLSNGETVGNIKPLKTKLKKVKYSSRQLSKKVKGSKSRQKQRQAFAVVHEKVTNIRKDYLHKVSSQIIKNHDIICIEDLNVKGLIEKNKNRLLAQSMADVSLGMFYNFLNYKADWYGKTIVKVDRYYPSSKTCSVCGNINNNCQLSDREWDCTSCKTNHNRDLNAARNILKQGLRKLLQSGSGTESDSKQKRVEAFVNNLDESMKPETFSVKNTESHSFLLGGE
jgi:putative transposase